AETLVEAARWLEGLPRRYGTDARMDPAAAMPDATYRSPFEHACRPASLGYVTTGVSADDDQAASAAGALPRFDDETGGCGADCLATLSGWPAATDLRGDLAGVQSAPVAWILPTADPLAYVNLVAAAFQRDAGVAAAPQLSAAGLMPFDERTRAPGIVFG